MGLISVYFFIVLHAIFYDLFKKIIIWFLDSYAISTKFDAEPFRCIIKTIGIFLIACATHEPKVIPCQMISDHWYAYPLGVPYFSTFEFRKILHFNKVL